MQVFIASDHGGFELKNKVLKFLLEKKEYDVLNLGPYSLDSSDDYPDFADWVCKKVKQDSGSLGILICTTGIGMSMAANKISDIRAALCWNVESAKMTRMDNDANVLCLGAGFKSVYENAVNIVTAFLETDFSGAERHKRRIKKIYLLEKKGWKID
ncbi:MAG: ribose 5-phosphate isomerase B [Candidatus Nealsonbacteria bacterium]